MTDADQVREFLSRGIKAQAEVDAIMDSIGERLADLKATPTAKGRAVVAYDDRLQDAGIPADLRSGLTIAFMDGWDAALEGQRDD